MDILVLAPSHSREHPLTSSGGGAPALSPLPQAYLGAAHGLAGILYVLLHALDLVEELDREDAGAAGAGGRERASGAVQPGLASQG